MNKIIKYIVGVVGLVAFAGCTGEFEDYNKNPYEPSTLPVKSFFPGMIDVLASPEENPCQRNNTFWAAFGGYVTASNSWGRQNLYATLNIDDSWNKWTVNWIFTEHIYPNWFAIARLTNNEGYYYQMAQLLRIHSMVMVASLQGPMPYTKVADGEFYVPYDDEETAWHAMFEDLDAVIAELQNAAASGSRPLADVDRVYNGDNEKWLKFANTLKLRMAMRISNADPAFAQQKAEEAVAAGVMTATSDSAYDNLNGRYRNGYYQVDVAWGGECRANACITAYMNGYEDPRREKYFTKSGADTYMGARSGVPSITTSTFANHSRLIYSELDPTTPMPIMYASEAAFLRAEGALKGWNMNGTAKELYEEGIRLSFAEWGASGVDAYIANSTKTPGNHTDSYYSSYSVANKSNATIAWNDGDSNDKKLEKIITQKWIANFPLGLEGWCDFRRTGYPYIFPPYANYSTSCDSERGQRRLRFSEDEYSRNAANTQAAVQMLSNGIDGDNTELWWALKDVKRY